MVLDVIFIAAVVICAVIGKRRGIVNTVLQALSTVLSLIVALAIKEPVTAFIEKTEVYKKVTAKLAEKIAPQLVGGEAANEGILSGITEKILSESTVVADMANSAAVSITNALIGVIITIIIFVLAFALIKVFSKVLNGIFRLPGLNVINRVLGMAWGVILVFFVSYLILAVGAGGFLADNEFFAEQIKASQIVKRLYENNLLLNLFI